MPAASRRATEDGRVGEGAATFEPGRGWVRWPENGLHGSTWAKGLRRLHAGRVEQQPKTGPPHQQRQATTTTRAKVKAVALGPQSTRTLLSTGAAGVVLAVLMLALALTTDTDWLRLAGCAVIGTSLASLLRAGWRLAEGQKL